MDYTLSVTWDSKLATEKRPAQEIARVLREVADWAEMGSLTVSANLLDEADRVVGRIEGVSKPENL